MAEYVMKTDTRTGRQRAVEKDSAERKNVVRVLPRDEQIRKYIKHPATKVGFPAGEGSAEWPNDAFTKKRVIDGDVRVEQAAAPEASEAAEQEVADKKTGAKAPEPVKEKPAKTES